MWCSRVILTAGYCWGGGDERCVNIQCIRNNLHTVHFSNPSLQHWRTKCIVVHRATGLAKFPQDQKVHTRELYALKGRFHCEPGQWHRCQPSKIWMWDIFSQKKWPSVYFALNIRKLCLKNGDSWHPCNAHPLSPSRLTYLSSSQRSQWVSYPIVLNASCHHTHHDKCEVYVVAMVGL